jgi:hypothetical protein
MEGTISSATAAKAPGDRTEGFSLALRFCAYLQGFLSVGAVGLEPTLLIRTRILSPVRLPIPPRPRVVREYTSQVCGPSAVQQASSG